MSPSGTIARLAWLFKLLGPQIKVVESARLYNCARCSCQVVICRHCDHGNRYCPECAPLAFRESHRRADAEYQKTDRGKENHTARQQRYLIRLEEEMTDKGSPGSLPESPSRANAEAVSSASAKEERDACSIPSPATNQPSGTTGISAGDSGHCCAWCSRLCPPYLRLDTLAHCTLEEEGDHPVPVARPGVDHPGDREGPGPRALFRPPRTGRGSPAALL